MSSIRKTDVSHIAKVAAPMYLIGGLKGYIKHPIFMIIKSAIDSKKAVRKIQLDVPNDFKKSYGLVSCLYINLAKRMPKKQAFEILRAVLLPLGIATMQANFREAEAERSFDNLVRYQQLAKEEGATRLNKVRIDHLSNDKYSYAVTRCMFYDFFSEMGVPELTSIMCSIDNAVFSSYLPNQIRFYRGVGNTICEGAAECEFLVENVGR
ncbi:MAG: L-2-amino-thiazoline-4-carboxylic acid hydrolase [Treponemataceae bacterium]|nr:L-2-amino-thiazoline-4-carboxylic acid hydrolase [Treponemataceae bacterium]